MDRDQYRVKDQQVEPTQYIFHLLLRHLQQLELLLLLLLKVFNDLHDFLKSILGPHLSVAIGWLHGIPELVFLLDGKVSI